MISNFIDWLSSLFYTNSLSYCQLLTPSVNDPSTLIAVDGSCITAFEVFGMQRYLTDFTENNYLASISDETADIFREAHHEIDFIFSRDQSRVKYELDNCFYGTIETIRRNGYKAEYLIQQQIDDLSLHCAYERTLIIVRTDGSMVRQIRNSPSTINDKKITVDNIPLAIQNPHIEAQNLLKEHTAYVKSFDRIFSSFIALKQLKSDALLTYIKEEIDLINIPSGTWEPLTTSDSMDFTSNPKSVDYISQPPLAYQLQSNDYFPVSNDRSIIESNGKFISTLSREYFPINPQPFSKFFRKIPLEIPLRISFRLCFGDESLRSALVTKRNLIMFFLFTPSTRDIDDALKELIRLSSYENKPLASGHVTFATWGRSIEEVQQYKKELKQLISSWGSQTVIQPPDKYHSLLSTIPAYTEKNPARSCVQPTERHITLLPVTRPCAPVTTGGICFSSLDGRILPYHTKPVSQAYGVNAIIGGMGSGKTVFSSVFNDAFIFAEGNTALPLMGYLDYGSGVHNFIRSCKQWLPDSLKHEAVCLPLYNSDGNAINFIEPQFGLNELEDREKAFAVSFITRLVNGTKAENVHEQLGNVISGIIDQLLYERTIVEPILYAKKITRYVNDEILIHKDINDLIENGIVVIDKSEMNSWWLIRDKLYDLEPVKYMKHARFCHRQGSPTLPHMIQLISTSQSITEKYSAFNIGGIPLINYIKASLEAVLCRYKNFFGFPSQIDVSQSRIIGVDLKGVASEGKDPESVNRNQLFAMLGKYIATRNFWRDEKHFFDIVPERYRKMYEKIVKQDLSIVKHQYIDEYKKWKSRELDDLIGGDDMVGRKYNLVTTLSTQFFKHLPEEHIDLLSNLFVLSLSSSDSDEIKKRYTLTDSFISEAERLLGTTQGIGRVLLYIGDYKHIEGKVVQLLRNHINSQYLWHFASDSEDEDIKSLAISRYGETEGFRRLAGLFKNGSAMPYISNCLNRNKYDESKSISIEDVKLKILQLLDGV